MLVMRIDPDDKTQYELSLWTNGTQNTPTTGTYSAPTVPTLPLRIGADQGGNYFAGVIDYVRVLDVARTDCRWWKMRLPDPKAAYVRFDMPMEIANATTLRVDDRSVYRNHGTAASGSSSGSITSATTISTQVTPVTLINPRIDYENESRLDIVAGGKIYLVEL
jgi:hypothetical protein